MAFNIADVFIALRAKDENVTSTLSGLKQTVTSTIAGIGQGINIALGEAIVGGVGKAVKSIVGIGTAVLDASSDFATATARMQGQLGLTDAGAEHFGNTMKAIFANNFGNDIDDVADSLSTVISTFNQIEGLLENESEDVIKRATEKSIALRDAFDADVATTSAAVSQLMKNFGLSVDQAYDFIASGFQNGLDANQDFLDTIGEYSTQFGAGGASAEQFFSIMRSGLSGTSLGTDKAADAFKEFRVRIQDGSELTKQGLEAVGLSVDKIQKGLADGTLTAVDAFALAQEGLRGMTDKNLQFQAGVALFGTQFEDLGTDAFLAMNLTSASLDNMVGAMDKVNKQYNTLPQFFEGIRRSVLVALTPITDTILDMANVAMPVLQGAFTAMKPAIDAFAAGARERLEGLLAKLQEFIAASDFEWSPTFKKIKLGDLFEFVQVSSADGSNSIGSINIADWFTAEWDNKFTKLKFGDFFEFGFTEGTDTINIADYFTFTVDKEGFVQKLTLGDFFSFIKGTDGAPTVLNLADYVQFTYLPGAEGKDSSFALNIPGILGLSSSAGTGEEGGGGKFRLNLADYVSIVYEKDSGETTFKIGDFFNFSKDEGGTEVLNIAEFMKVVYKPEEGFTRFKLGDFIDLDAEEIATLVQSFTDINTAIKTFVDGIILNLPTADGYIVTVKDNLKLFTDGVSDWGTKLGDAATALEDWASRVQEGVGGMGDNITSFLLFVTGLSAADTATENIGDKVESAGLKFVTFGAYISGVRSNLKLFEDAVNLLIDFLAEAWDWSTTGIGIYFTRLKTELEDIDTKIDAFPQKFKDFFSGLGESLAGDVEGVKLGIADFIDFAIPDDFKTTFQELANFEMPDFGPQVKAVIANLILFKWPEFASSVSELIQSIVAWAWPEISETVKSLITKITGWSWPEISATVTTWITKITDWEWPDFGATLTSWINTITNFEWPTLTMPGWVQSLLNIASSGGPDPAGVANNATGGLDYSPGGPSISDQTGYVLPGAPPQEPPPKDDTVGGGGGGGGGGVRVDTIIVNNNVDKEKLLWDLSQLLAFG